MLSSVQQTQGEMRALTDENCRMKKVLCQAEKERDTLKSILESAQQQIASDQQRLSIRQMQFEQQLAKHDLLEEENYQLQEKLADAEAQSEEGKRIALAEQKDQLTQQFELQLASIKT